MKHRVLNLQLLRKIKGQSLVELSLILLLLLIMLTGAVEFGTLLNQYTTVVDAARAGARFASNDEPFVRVVSPSCPVPFCVSMNFFHNVDIIIEGAELGRDPAPPAIDRDKGALSPIRLQPEEGDDVVVSVFSIHNGVVTRFPASEGGWSYYRSLGLGYPGQTSEFTSAEMEARLNGLAPDTGMVLVEIFYNYHQLLGFWRILGIPDPILVHTYAIMPVSAAEPTPIPIP
jgi:hypothetical protein